MGLVGVDRPGLADANSIVGESLWAEQDGLGDST